MLQVDEFESAFRAAIKDPYHYQPINLQSVLIISDLNESDTRALQNRIREFSPVFADRAINWESLNGEDFRSTEDLLRKISLMEPDLICSYRNLHSEAWKYPHSLGEHLDVLLHKTQSPVLIVPHPQADYAADYALKQTQAVMAITDHLTADDRLVNYSVSFLEPGGRLYLSHIEDQHRFDRIMDAISKLPEVDTETVREKLAQQLLKEPRDYIASCHKVLKKELSTPPEVIEHVQFGHHLREYRQLIENQQIDLLVMNTLEDEHPAIHGMAYPLLVEIRQIPLLML